VSSKAKNLNEYGNAFMGNFSDFNEKWRIVCVDLRAFQLSFLFVQIDADFD